MKLKEVLNLVWQPLDRDQVATFLSIIWIIWKARCTKVFENKKPKPENTIRSAMALSQSIRLTSLPSIVQRMGTTASCFDPMAHVNEDACICFLDGSSKHPNMGGTAYLLEHQGRLIRYEIIYKSDAVSPFQMETVVLLSAVRAALNLRISNCVFCTDAELLAETLKPPKLLQQIQTADWRVYTELIQIAMLLREHSGFLCTWIPRGKSESKSTSKY